MARRRLSTILTGVGAAIALTVAPATAQELDTSAAEIGDPVEETTDAVTDAVEDTVDEVLGEDEDEPSPEPSESESDGSDGSGAGGQDSDPLDPVTEPVTDAVDDVTDEISDADDDGPEQVPSPAGGDDPGTDPDDGSASSSGSDAGPGDRTDRSHPGTQVAERRPGLSGHDQYRPGFALTLGDLGDVDRRRLGGLGLAGITAPGRRASDHLLLAPDVAAPEVLAEPDVAGASPAEGESTASSEAPTRAVRAGSSDPLGAPGALQAFAALMVLGSGLVWKTVREDLASSR